MQYTAYLFVDDKSLIPLHTQPFRTFLQYFLSDLIDSIILGWLSYSGTSGSGIIPVMMEVGVRVVRTDKVDVIPNIDIDNMAIMTHFESVKKISL